MPDAESEPFLLIAPDEVLRALNRYICIKFPFLDGVDCVKIYTERGVLVRPAIVEDLKPPAPQPKPKPMTLTRERRAGLLPDDGSD